MAFHALGFGVAYYGMSTVWLGHGPRLLFEPRPAVGASILVAAAALVAWTLVVFRSWRFQAKIDSGHELCTRGPFRWIRHPIYLSTDLLFLGSFLWVPTATVVAGSLLAFAGAELRARAEERVMAAAFGGAYRAYAARTKRFIPGLF